MNELLTGRGLKSGYTAALRQENVTAVSSPISRFNKRGIVTADGKEYPLDVAVIATGYDVVSTVIFICKGLSDSMAWVNH
jgi:cation diffusion facilitator CzcD-associated flavoprotein CzcO